MAHEKKYWLGRPSQVLQRVQGAADTNKRIKLVSFYIAVNHTETNNLLLDEFGDKQIIKEIQRLQA